MHAQSSQCFCFFRSAVSHSGAVTQSPHPSVYLSTGGGAQPDNVPSVWMRCSGTPVLPAVHSWILSNLIKNEQYTHPLTHLPLFHRFSSLPLTSSFCFASFKLGGTKCLPRDLETTRVESLPHLLAAGCRYRASMLRSTK